MEKAYWLGRKRASLKMAQNAASSEARLIHYDLAGRYGLNAVSAETQAADPANSLPLPIYATGSNPSFDDFEVRAAEHAAAMATPLAGADADKQ